jgi:hypothetical protein
MGLDLTPTVTAAMDKVLAGVLEELRAWGIDLRHPPEQF